MGRGGMSPDSEQILIHFCGIAVMCVIAASFLHALEFDNEKELRELHFARVEKAHNWMNTSTAALEQFCWSAINETEALLINDWDDHCKPAVTAAQNMYTAMMIIYDRDGPSDGPINGDQMAVELGQLDANIDAMELNLLDPDMKELLIELIEHRVRYQGTARPVVDPETGERAIKGYGWDYPSAVYFMCTIVSTIGYGTFVPMTTGGKVFVMINAFVGVGYFGMFLAMVSSRVNDVLKQRVMKSNPGPFEPTKLVKMLLTVNAGYIVALSMLGPLLASWSFSDSLYFSVLTFMTIGLGDVVPVLDADSTYTFRTMSMFTYSICTLLGMALLASAIGSFAEVWLNVKVQVGAVAGLSAHRKKKKGGKVKPKPMRKPQIEMTGI